MNGIVWRFFQTAGIAVLLLLLAGCNTSTQVANAIPSEALKRSAWLVYWDVDAGSGELNELESRLNTLVYFAAYFDKNDHLFIPAELSDKKQAAKGAGYQSYLSFVNDKQKPDGTAVLKDLEVLRRLFADDVSMERHIDEILALTLQAGYGGIEIDYERIWKDDQIERSFGLFVEKLYRKALNNNLKLRVVLEPGAPFAAANLPQGPEYVVMFYNLFGLHSGPGPKADTNFIKKVITRMAVLPGDKAAAFSAGGCLWGDNGVRSLLTGAEAEALAVAHRAKKKRDPNSQSIVFAYQDKGVSYQVWYADVQTLSYWISLAREQGIHSVSLWRLGGNVAIGKLD